MYLPREWRPVYTRPHPTAKHPHPHPIHPPTVTSKYSGNAVRTTHLTGASTDMGIALGHILKGRYDEWWKVQLHGVAVVGFFIGGVLGYFAFEVRLWCRRGGVVDRRGTLYMC